MDQVQELQRKLIELSKLVQPTLDRINVKSKSIKKSILSKCLLSALEAELGVNYKMDSDIENLI